MANLSQQKREKMTEFLETIRQEHKNDDGVLIAINEIENELNEKKYGLVWEQHEENVDVQMRDNIPVFTECKDKEINAAPGDGYNFILEGDNLHSLRLLEKTHSRKINVIYIDPPYNRGKDDFVYDDKKIDENDDFRHSKWASFMYERLSYARELLTDDGLIFIHIDDNEQACLNFILDDIFADNYIDTLVWDLGTGTQAGQFTRSHEYIYVFAKDKRKIKNFPCLNEGVIKHSALKKISKKNPPVTITFPAGFPCQCKDTIFSGEIGGSEKEYIKGEMIIKNGALANDVTITAGFAMRNETEAWIRGEKVYDTKGQVVKGFYFNSSGILYYEKEKSIENPKTVLSKIGSTKDGSDELAEILGEGMFDFPKPTNVVMYLLRFATSLYDSPIVLDFFAGSGTTGHAVMKLNAEDGGNRKFILCTNNENNICEEVTYERIKRVINGYGDTEGIPANVKYFRSDFVPKNSEDVTDELLNHISEMVELENGIKLDEKKYVLILSDDEADELEKRWSEYPDIKALYISNDVLLTTSQRALFSNVKIHIIPDYYFKFEMQETGEVW